MNVWKRAAARSTHTTLRPHVFLGASPAAVRAITSRLTMGAAALPVTPRTRVRARVLKDARKAVIAPDIVAHQVFVVRIASGLVRVLWMIVDSRLAAISHRIVVDTVSSAIRPALCAFMIRVHC